MNTKLLVNGKLTKGKGDDLSVLDPATGKHLHRTRAVLEKEWKPVGFPTLVVVGPRVARR